MNGLVAMPLARTRTGGDDRTHTTALPLDGLSLNSWSFSSCGHVLLWRVVGLWLAVLIIVLDGVNCVEDCSQIQCLNGASCEPGPPSKCVCLPNFSGQLCEFESLCIEVPPPIRGTVLYTTAPRYTNFSVSAAQYTVGTVAQYQCQEGFKTTAFDLISTCRSSGLWDPPPPTECQFTCNATSCPSVEDTNRRFTQCCALDDRPVGCCRNVTKILLEDRFHSITGNCRFALQRSLVPCERELASCYESLATYNYSCPDLHGCKSRIDNPENISSALTCEPVAGPGAELCQSNCNGFYCLQREHYCLPKSCVSSQALAQIAFSETRMNCDLEKIFLGVRTCSGTLVSVKCYGGGQGSASTLIGNCTSATCPTSTNPERSVCCMLQGQPVSCCTTGISQLLTNRFRYISGQCAADLGRQLQPCAHRLVQCLNDPISFNFTCPDSHGCLVSEETPSHCEKFVGAGSQWCTSKRCSAIGCVTTSFCMSKACNVLEQRYRMAQSDALLKCDSDITFSRKHCFYANSTIECSGDNVQVQASTTDGCTDVLADDPDAFCTNVNGSPECCKIGSVSLGCCSERTKSTVQRLRTLVDSATCNQALIALLRPSGEEFVTSLQSGLLGSALLSAVPTFGPTTGANLTASQCARLLGDRAMNCTLSIVEASSAEYQQPVTFCLPPTCADTSTLIQVGQSEIFFRCLLLSPPCPLEQWSLVCQDITGNVTRYATEEETTGTPDTSNAHIAVAIGCSVGGVLLVALLFLLIIYETRRRSSERLDDKLELTDNPARHK
eukprot:scpid36699/ scgid4423/ 